MCYAYPFIAALCTPQTARQHLRLPCRRLQKVGPKSSKYLLDVCVCNYPGVSLISFSRSGAPIAPRQVIPAERGVEGWARTDGRPGGIRLLMERFVAGHLHITSTDLLERAGSPRRLMDAGGG